MSDSSRGRVGGRETHIDGAHALVDLLGVLVPPVGENEERASAQLEAVPQSVLARERFGREKVREEAAQLT